MVLDDGRGSLPFALVHGEPLVACAAWALGEAGVTLVDLGTPWADLVEADLPVVLHDPLCPLTPPDFLAACVERAEATGAVVVGVRPVTDTVKRVDGGYVGATVDRTSLIQVASPVVLPAGVVATLGGLDGLPTDDPAVLVARLATRFAVEQAAAPPQARRVTSPDELSVLESLTTRAGTHAATGTS